MFPAKLYFRTKKNNFVLLLFYQRQKISNWICSRTIFFLTIWNLSNEKLTKYYNIFRVRWNFLGTRVANKEKFQYVFEWKFLIKFRFINFFNEWTSSVNVNFNFSSLKCQIWVLLFIIQWLQVYLQDSYWIEFFSMAIKVEWVKDSPIKYCVTQKSGFSTLPPFCTGFFRPFIVTKSQALSPYSVTYFWTKPKNGTVLATLT